VEEWCRYFQIEQEKDEYAPTRVMKN